MLNNTNGFFIQIDPSLAEVFYSQSYLGGTYTSNGSYNVASIESSLATPLPSTWTMLIAGFLGLAFFAYRGSKNDGGATAAV